MEDKKPPRRERERLAQRQDILDAAIELFSKKGYSNVSMHEIAERAEFAIGTLYKFFVSKEDLYKALLREQAYKFHDAVSKAITEPEQEIEKLRNFVKVKGEVFRANAAMIRLYFAETHGAGFNVMAGLDSEIRELHSKTMQALTAVFQRGIEKNQFKRIADPYYLAVALESFINAFLFLWLEDPERHPYPEDPDLILNILFKGLIN